MYSRTARTPCNVRSHDRKIKQVHPETPIKDYANAIINANNLVLPTHCKAALALALFFVLGFVLPWTVRS